MTVLSSRRTLLLFLVVIGVQLLLLAFQIRREHNIRLIRVWAVEAFTPMDRASTASIDWVAGLWGDYINLKNTHAQNQRLQAEVDQLRLQMDRLRGRAAEADRLATLLSFRRSNPGLPLLAAQVISASLAPSSKVIYIDRGEHDGVREDMGVITPVGVVGKVLEVFPDSSQVLLIDDRESGVGALLAASRTQGVVKGNGGPDLLMNYVTNNEKVAVGESVLTSGLDQIFPNDLPLGTVVAVHPGSPFKQIEIRPAAKLDRLEEVLVILSRPKPPAPSSTGDPPPGN